MDYFEVTKRDPGYLTDLRMKRYETPKRYFDLNTAKVRLEPGDLGIEHYDYCVRALARSRGWGTARSFDFFGFVRKFVRFNPDVVTQTMCFYVNCLGSWADAVAIGSAVRDLKASVPATPDGGRLLSVAGYALCIGAYDRQARTLWKLARPSLATAYDRFFLALREATAELKRYGDPEEFERAITRAEADARNLQRNGHTSEDSVFALALTLNVLALRSVRNRRPEEAARLITKALHLMEGVGVDRLTIEESIAARYQIMVMQNHGLLAVYSRDWYRAADIFQEVVSFARRKATDSLSEALSLLGYVLLRGDHVAGGLAVLEEAESLLRGDTRPDSEEAVWRLLANGYDRLGEPRDAARWLRKLDAPQQDA